MASAPKLIFLLTFLTQNISGEQETHELRMQEETHEIHVLSLPKNADFCLVSRSMADGELLLWNTSDSSPVNSTLHGELADRLRVRNISKDLYLDIILVSQSDTGRYRIECRTGSKVTYQKNFTLTVCDRKYLRVFATGTTELPCDITAEAELSPTITWFRETGGKWRTVFVDGSETLNSGMKDLQGRVQVTQNNSLLISNFTDMDGLYTCVAPEEQKCGSIVRGYTRQQYYYLRSEGQGVTLPCFSFTADPAGTSWSTPYGTIKADVPPKSPPETSSPRPQRRGEMYMMDGRENTNYSLVIPSLELNHSGWYSCATDVSYVPYRLLVCPESTSVTVFFSEGSEVSLSCDSDSVDAAVVVWFRYTDKRVILDSLIDRNITMKNLDQRYTRYNVSFSLTSVTISNLSQEDSGEYWCLRYTDRGNHTFTCESLAKTNLVYQGKPSLGSVFHAVRDTVGSCALVGTVCAVVTVILRSCRRDGDSL